MDRCSVQIFLDGLSVLLDVINLVLREGGVSLSEIKRFIELFEGNIAKLFSHQVVDQPGDVFVVELLHQLWRNFFLKRSLEFLW